MGGHSRYELQRPQVDDTEALARARAGQEPPHAWGDYLTRDPKEGPGYFCTPCWRAGEPRGFHPHSVPPCDPPIRGKERYP